MANGETKNPDDLLSRVARSVDDTGMILSGERILVGVSGGLDSSALLAMLNDIARSGSPAFDLTAAHFDHGLRDDSAEDADFVVAIADEMGVDCIVERADPDTLPPDGAGAENAARNARYDFFRRAAADCGAAAVALAHHADDNCETILFRLFRGTALRGLAGIPAERVLGERPTLRIIRPLLGIRRAAILPWARSRGLRWRDDPSNRESRYRRNVIRNDILPLLREKLNARVDEAVLRLGRTAGETGAFIEEKGGELLADAVTDAGPDRVLLDAVIFAGGHPVVRKTAIRMMLASLALPERDLSAEHLSTADAVAVDGGAADLPGGCRARRVGNQFILSHTVS